MPADYDVGLPTKSPKYLSGSVRDSNEPISRPKPKPIVDLSHGSEAHFVRFAWAAKFAQTLPADSASLPGIHVSDHGSIIHGCGLCCHLQVTSIDDGLH